MKPYTFNPPSEATRWSNKVQLHGEATWWVGKATPRSHNMKLHGESVKPHHEATTWSYTVSRWSHTRKPPSEATHLVAGVEGRLGRVDDEVTQCEAEAVLVARDDHGPRSWPQRDHGVGRRVLGHLQRTEDHVDRKVRRQRAAADRADQSTDCRSHSMGTADRRGPCGPKYRPPVRWDFRGPCGPKYRPPVLQRGPTTRSNKGRTDHIICNIMRCSKGNQHPHYNYNYLTEIRP